MKRKSPLLTRLINGAIRWFFFTAGERNATVFLAFLLLLCFFIPPVYRNFRSAQLLTDEAVKHRVDSFFQSLRSVPLERHARYRYAKQDRYGKFSGNKPAMKRKASRFRFDPNTATLDTLVMLGLSPAQARVVIKYRSAGGRFRKPDDLARIYVLDSELVQSLIPWIAIQSAECSLKQPSSDSLSAQMVELNTADSAQLVNLRGIGPVLARRIVRYRNLLGGFYTIEQLDEVYGINSELVTKLSHQLVLDTSLIRRINLNTVSYELLKKHPYITTYQAKAIIYYRNRAGKIRTADELLSNKLLPPASYNKFRNYCEF